MVMVRFAQTRPQLAEEPLQHDLHASIASLSLEVDVSARVWGWGSWRCSGWSRDKWLTDRSRVRRRVCCQGAASWPGPPVEGRGLCPQRYPTAGPTRAAQRRATVS